MADDDNVLPLRTGRVIAEVGGVPDETGVALALFGEDLEPDVVSAELGCEPTRTHRKGQRRGPRSPPYVGGAWFLELRGESPAEPDGLLRALLARFPRDPEFWARLRAKYQVRVLVALHSGGWNRGFGLSPAAIDLVAATGAELGFDLYFHGDEE
ncbi:DUF4279 domain-containing protein [Nannocystis punicea]|uniref:DUF4279 domain-containing protein n=1 Tax=Nannocystis punicea TaxID=2995304 RepID=A0ABY7GSZ7_9BACT|nr:DUF4279 domain-containing protein [Nannocystis poenicansa]WAS89994.1 DUF4279 domain-containing protein [Nannocystis poenicansa]